MYVNVNSLFICSNLCCASPSVSSCLPLCIRISLPCLSVALSVDLSVYPSVCPSVLLRKQGACIIRLERGSRCSGDNTLASHGCCRATSRDRCYIRPVWMNNEECLRLQNIPASLLLPCVFLLAQTGSCWASGTGAVGREGGGTGEHRGDWGKTGAPLTVALSFFWKEISFTVKSTLYAMF